jgi:hypothetical protein
VASLAESMATWMLAEPLESPRHQPRTHPSRSSAHKPTATEFAAPADEPAVDTEDEAWAWAPEEEPVTPFGPPAPGRVDLAAQRAALAATLTTGRELLRRRATTTHRDGLPSGSASLDQLLGGGMPRRCLVELVGGASSGRLAAVLALLAATTARGDVAALVDLGDALAPSDALAAGIDTSRLLWIRPTQVRQALAAAEATVQGGFPLVVVDLGLPPLPGGRGAEASWLRLARAASHHGATLLVASPYRATGTAAEVVLGLELPGKRFPPTAHAASRQSFGVDRWHPLPLASPLRSPTKSPPANLPACLATSPLSPKRSAWCPPRVLCGLTRDVVLHKHRGEPAEGHSQRRLATHLDLADVLLPLAERARAAAPPPATITSPALARPTPTPASVVTAGIDDAHGAAAAGRHLDRTTLASHATRTDRTSRTDRAALMDPATRADRESLAGHAALADPTTSTDRTVLTGHASLGDRAAPAGRAALAEQATPMDQAVLASQAALGDRTVLGDRAALAATTESPVARERADRDQLASGAVAREQVAWEPVASRPVTREDGAASEDDLAAAVSQARNRARPAKPSGRLRPASATARRGWRAQAPRALTSLGERLRAGELGGPLLARPALPSATGTLASSAAP